MTFYEIITTVYANAWALKQFTLCDRGEGAGVEIQAWDVPDITRPTHDQIMAMETPEMAFQYTYNCFLTAYLAQLDGVMNNVARQKGYDNTISCVSYLNSTNLTWKAEAVTFSAWRDSVWNYLYAQQVLILNKTRPIPTVSQLNAELPAIVWPI